jgi:tripartite-type tricarboxylate transporter receptor subunit TctC
MVVRTKSATAAPDDPYFKGKVVEYIVCTVPGGGSDAFARFLVRWWPKFIPGKPKFVVKYMPGAGNVMGRNYAYNNAPNDGTVWVSTSTGDQIAGLLGWKAVRYDLKKQRPLVGLSGGTLLYTTSEIAKNWDQVYEKEVLVWGYQPPYSSQQDSFLFVAQEMLGFKVKKYIFSYGGSGDARRGFLAGEINFSGSTVSTYLRFDKQFEETGEMKFIMQIGSFDDQGNIVRRDPPVGHVPTLYDLYKSKFGKEPSGPAWNAYKTLIALAGNIDKTACMPPTVDPKIWKIVADACDRMVRDPAFVADVKKRFPGLSFVAGKELQKVYDDQIIGADPKAINWLKQLLIEKGGVVDR